MTSQATSIEETGGAARTGAWAGRLAGLVFFLQPVAFGNWLARIPEVRDGLGLSPAELAGALLGGPAGIVATLPFAGALVARIGARATLLFGFATFLPAAGLPSLARSGPGLFLALMAVGALVSVLELGLNVEADRLEKATGRLIMSTCHGFWSLGLLVGTLIGACLAGTDLSLEASLFGLAALLVLPCLAAAACVPAGRAASPAKASGSILQPSRALLGICAFVVGVALTEGAAADWSGIFLRDRFGLPTAAAAFAFVPFAASVALGRFCGDALRGRLGLVRTARYASAAALVGAVMVTLAPQVPLAMLGLGLLGLGVSTGFPLAVTAAAALGDRPPAANVAFLSMMALMGFLVGPPLIGGIAQHAGIQAGLGGVIPGLLLSFACARALRGNEPAPASRPEN